MPAFQGGSREQGIGQVVDVQQQIKSSVQEPALTLDLPPFENIPTPLATLRNVLSGRPPQLPVLRPGRGLSLPPI